jgi:monoamine oxidase
MSRRRPIAWHVARWGDDPWSLGSWCTLRPGASPADRASLAEPVDGRLVLAGEAVDLEQPGMLHGAWASGVRAADWCLAEGSPSDRVIVVGAGIAGLAAARHLADAGRDVRVLEARSRLGGRIHTVELAGVAADAGAAWLQQERRNPLLPIARRLGLRLVRTGFRAPRAVSPRGPVPLARIEQVRDAIEKAVRGWDAPPGGPADRPLGEVLGPLLSQTDPELLHVLRGTLEAEVVLESGTPIEELSARWTLREDGVGDGDHWIVEGCGALIDHLAAGLDVRVGRAVRRIAWDAHGVAVETDEGELRAERCICAVPLALLKAGRPELRPGLPEARLQALARLGVGVVEKVLLRFDERWWPHAESGYLRWHDDPASWVEWADHSDGAGAPLVAALIAGPAVARHHRGRSDAEVAQAATDALARLASHA